MSADNWTVCPRCIAKDPFMNRKVLGSQTFREDFEFHMTADGVFTAEYRGRCTSCHFRHEFKHEETVPVMENR